VEGIRPPLACFLSHVHSDHLVGLESLKAPFVYCSAATKEILLRLERYPHRINFELGILESRKQHYKHLKKLLKPIPLETPTRIQLAPGNDIQVTLFDANHCTGAVMFLIEGDGKAVLYTGDIRSEPWFVNALTRNPVLIEYTSGLKTLDCIYLDTSFTDDIAFPTKAEGLRELLQKVAKYPPETKFHFAAWTFGYEEVWMALSRALKSPASSKSIL
jgi:DNA cross-link repair 1C protein